MTRRLEVWLHDQQVGQISETDRDVEFRLLDAYRQLTVRPVLGQKFEDDLEKAHRNRRGQKLSDSFANLIPESRLRDVIEEASGLESGDDVALLAFVGRDLPGAVIVRESEDERWRPISSDRPPSLQSRASDSESDIPLRFSLAGVQLKFSMLRDSDRLTLPASDQGGEWIVKLDSPVFTELPENEFSMLVWARESGFEVPELHLHPIEHLDRLPRRLARQGSRALAVRRFDRGTEGRVHQEDFAQAVGLPPSLKYEQVTHEAMARLIRRFVDEDALDEYVRRLTFVIASGNNDAHLKNWSLIYPDRISAKWSPLYDQVATVAWENPDRALALQFGGVKKFSLLDRSSGERFARKADIEAERVFETIHDTLERLQAAWKAVAGDLPIPESHREALRRHWETVPLLREAGRLT